MSSLLTNKTVFRLLGDFMHLASKAILIGTIHIKRDGQGISILTQALYLAVFLTRYLDIFWTAYKVYNTIFKLTYIVTSIYTLYILYKRYPHTREREEQFRVAFYILAFSGLVAPFAAALDVKAWSAIFHPTDVLWAFSIALESVCILPQLNLLRFVDIPTAINSYYLLALGSYRFFYLLNWIWTAFKPAHTLYPVPFVFGIIQTWLYIEFALVYYRRQGLKLRTGEGYLDNEDFERGGLILGQILGGATGGRWQNVQSWISQRTGGSAARRNQGLSVSADVDTYDAEARREREAEPARNTSRPGRSDQRDAEEGRAFADVSSEDEDSDGELAVDPDAGKKIDGTGVWRN